MLCFPRRIAVSRVLEINNLTVKDGKGYILKDISLSLDSNETMAFIGESGSGKTMTLKAILSILPSDVEKVEGDVLIDGTELYNLKKDEKRIKLGTTVGFVPQNTVNYLHPLLRIKDQMIDGYITFHGRKKKEEALDKARKGLEEVGIKDVERVLSSYPSELSGGMKQRVNIASALMMDPSLLISDEPTSALDKVVQKQVASLYLSLLEKNKVALLVVSHDLVFVERIADKIAVFYAGEIVESGRKEEIFSSPIHPYTKALMALKPSMLLDKTRPLEEIKGYISEEDRNNEGCVFSSRCPKCRKECMERVEERKVSDTHRVKCILSDGRTQ